MVWRAFISINKKTKALGTFKNPQKAAQVYNIWALKIHGDFARLNTFCQGDK